MIALEQCLAPARRVLRMPSSRALCAAPARRSQTERRVGGVGRREIIADAMRANETAVYAPIGRTSALIVRNSPGNPSGRATASSTILGTRG